jgi:hypothetical protein
MHVMFSLLLRKEYITYHLCFTYNQKYATNVNIHMVVIKHPLARTLCVGSIVYHFYLILNVQKLIRLGDKSIEK